MNAYFQLDIKQDGVYLNLLPEKDGGKGFDVKEISYYLEKNKIEFDKRQLVDTVLGVREFKTIKLSQQVILPINESVNITINQDRTQALGHFYPPSVGGKQMTREEIINDLVRLGIKYGAKEEGIASFLQNREYCINYELAAALLPVEGKSAKITYNFNTNLRKKPKSNEDGSVDFHQLDSFSPIEKGALLATLEPAVQGKPGIDLFGNIIQPHKVVKLILRHGRKIHLSEDGCSMFSDVSGHAMLVDNKVFVEDTFEVAADVDASTGDINYEGSVYVKGSVRTGYQIIAKGDITVEQVVEGAILVAGGQIILKCGIQGMNKGSLSAGANIIAKFIENATINAGGYVATDAILHSKVSAKGDIIVNGKRGFITGGEIRSGTMIFAKTAGSSMGTNTLLEVGVDPALMEEYRKLEKTIPVIQAENDKITQILTVFAKKIKSGEKLSSDKIAYIRTLTSSKEELEINIAKIDMRLLELQEVMDNTDSGCVKISSMIYPGCKVVIANVVYFVRTEMARCSLVRDRADIKVGPF